MLVDTPWYWFVGVIALSIGAYGIGILDKAGSAVAGVMAALILLGVGPGWLFLLVLFVAVSYGATRFGYELKRRRSVHEPRRGRRGIRNVFANGAPPTLVAISGLFLPDHVIAFPFATAIAVAAADTLASELGVFSDRAVLITEPQRDVRPGTNGGISVVGTVASIAGALMVATVAHLAIPLAWHLVPFVVVLGLAGSLIDSLLGATWEGDPGRIQGPLTKNDVNFISISIPTLVALLATSLGIL